MNDQNTPTNDTDQDDTEGHTAHYGRMAPVDAADDTEGNSINSHVAPAGAGDDVEGNSYRRGFDAPVEDDTEGSVGRIGHVAPAEAGDDDTEGNAGHVRF